MGGRSCNNTIYFRNIPNSYQLNELKKLFSEFGLLKNIFIHRDRSYGMVEYADLSSCNKAIESLNQVPPLNMHVSMAKTRKKDKQDSDGETASSSNKGPHNKNVESLNDREFKISRKKEKQESDGETTSVSSKNESSYNNGLGMNEDSETVLYLDRFNKIIDVFVDDKGIVYAPIHRVTGYRRVVRKKNSNAGDFYANPENYDILDILGDENNEKTVNMSINQKNEKTIGNKPNKYKNVSKVKNNCNGLNSSRIESLPSSSWKSEARVSHNRMEIKAIELPLNEYVRVKVSEVSPKNKSVAWVQLYGASNILANIVREVSDAVLKKKPFVPKVGQYCLAKYENFWYRAIVLHTEPNLHIRCIDYGNEVENFQDSVWTIPSALSMIRAQAICIHLEDGAPKELSIDDQIEIKAVHFTNDVYHVQLLCGLYPKEASNSIPNNESCKTSILSKNIFNINNQIPNKSYKNNMMSIIKVNGRGTLNYTFKLSDKKFVASFIPYDLAEMLSDLQLIEKDGIDDPSFKPDVGDLVDAQLDEEGWCRCIIQEIENSVYKVAFIDFGEERNVNQVRPVRPKLVNLPWFSCVCRLPSENAALIAKEQDGVDFKIITLEPEIIVILSNASGEISKAQIEAWRPKIYSNNTPRAAATEIVKLMSGEKVSLVHQSNGYLFIRNRKCDELFDNVTKLMLNEMKSAPKLTQKPKAAQMVAACYMDGWYRAVINTVNGDSASILYIDYGNEETQPWKKFKILPAKLKQIPFTLFKIKLKGHNKKFERESLEWLEQIASRNIRLMATFENTMEDGITLTTKEGKDILQEIMELENKPHLKNTLQKVQKHENQSLPKKEQRVPGKNDPRIYLEDLPVVELRPGEYQLIIHHILNLESGLFSFSLCTEKIKDTYRKLANQINEYLGNSVQFDPYAPENNEVVLAKYPESGEWRRATVILTNGDKEYTLFFLDDGLTISVNEQNIRRISSDLVVFEALATLGVLEDIPEDCSEQTQEKLTQLLKFGTKITGRIINKDENGIQSVEIPSINQALKRENLA